MKNSTRARLSEAFDDLTGHPHPSLQSNVITGLHRRVSEAEPGLSPAAKTIAIAAATLLLVVLVAGLAIWSKHSPLTPIPGTHNQPTALTEAQAIKVALKQPLFLAPDDFPQQPGRQDCTILGGGPYPGLHIPGSCGTSAANDGAGGWLVTFTQYWDARLFNSGPPSDGTLSYHATYDVDAHANVTKRDEGGDFPPQGAR
jgi:hypothetical protein